jgi:glycosyltransferase involved in cell wall biosynthesis
MEPRSDTLTAHEIAPVIDTAATVATPRVSAIITAYNSARYIHHAIDSILAQTYRPFEIVVVDDGSQDDTADAVEAMYPHDVRVVRQANAGPNGARNRGVRETTGEWIAFLDADDTWTPHRLAAQVALTANPRIGLISGHAVDEKPEYAYAGRVTFEMMWERNYVGVPTTLIRRTAMEELGGFDEDRNLVGAEDYNTWLRFVHSHWEVHLVPAELFHYTSAPGSLYSQKERCLRGELLNVSRLAERLQLPADIVRWKQVQILEAYTRGCIQERELRRARQFAAQLWQVQPSLSAAKWWLTTWVPPALLDLRRRWLEPFRDSVSDPTASSSPSKGEA